MAQDGTAYGNQSTRVLRAPSLPFTPTDVQDDLVEKIKSLDGIKWGSRKKRQFQNFTLNNPAASREINVTIEVDPYFAGLNEFGLFLQSLKISNKGTTYENGNASNERVYRQSINGVIMKFYRHGQNAY